MKPLPSRKLTYPPKMAFWRWVSFPKVGYVNSLEGKQLNFKESTVDQLSFFPKSVDPSGRGNDQVRFERYVTWVHGVHHFRTEFVAWENRAPKDWQVAFSLGDVSGFKPNFLGKFLRWWKGKTLLERLDERTPCHKFFCRLSYRSMRFTNPRHPGPPGEVAFEPPFTSPEKGL